MECFFHICHNPCPREMNSQNLAVAFNQRSHAMKQEAHLRHILLNHNAFPSMFGGITVNFDYYLGEVKRDKRRNFRPRDDTGQHTMASSATITAWLLSPATVQMYQLCKAVAHPPINSNDDIRFCEGYGEDRGGVIEMRW
ncbi:predicted protein [Histoplasma capsulatum G186AR]|uniref:Uncharacterized protein n=1 Tax=Ajellomyces capsulatus (strain G186AR / H82 / ATCC MYA-2454 / RMSCC 2432) TaxID=447093 RepID=C0NXR3_AJECG|nr:uncharacterized protein HCBG_07707 [Histoplasma capsulatum G186AR]EEH03581.1 predicted protein [Histoplasma capsulatum G186AR]